ncbi:MAG: hypothetical protein HYR86_17105 [Candidatus Rokubacteria bacterium]|nr:hypothetical protein [Candidatus Rokubacteria bacterium]
MLGALVSTAVVLAIMSATGGCAWVAPENDQGMSPIESYNPTGTSLYKPVGPGGGTGVK